MQRKANKIFDFSDQFLNSPQIINEPMTFDVPSTTQTNFNGGILPKTAGKLFCKLFGAKLDKYSSFRSKGQF